MKLCSVERSAAIASPHKTQRTDKLEQGCFPQYDPLAEVDLIIKREPESSGVVSEIGGIIGKVSWAGGKNNSVFNKAVYRISCCPGPGLSVGIPCHPGDPG